MGAAPGLGLNARQVLAVAGATVALAFVFQWLLGVLRLASVARFLPISVTHGFAAGVGLSMVLGQVRNGFGSGALGDARTAWHAWRRWGWRRWPGGCAGAGHACRSCSRRWRWCLWGWRWQVFGAQAWGICLITDCP